MTSESRYVSKVFRNVLTVKNNNYWQNSQFQSEIFSGHCGCCQVSWYYVVDVTTQYSITIAVMIFSCSSPLDVSVKLDNGQDRKLPDKFKISGRPKTGTKLGELVISKEDLLHHFSDRTTFTLKFKLRPGPVTENVSVESQLQRDFTGLLSNEQLSDVTITVGQRTFYAQRAILSVRSAVFAAMFQSGMQESKPNCTISVEDIEPDVFQDVLRFIYTGQVQALKTLGYDLLAAAEKYALNDLKSICEHHLCGHTTKETALQNLLQADLFHAQQLKDAVIRFVCGNIKQMHEAD